ncbi:MAG: hypothetical protein U5N58_06260 [Actinomycetota bacterium]|nr:hypothetical protein [Actinomycetota bacterium]
MDMKRMYEGNGAVIPVPESQADSNNLVLAGSHYYSSIVYDYRQQPLVGCGFYPKTVSFHLF